MGTYHFDSHIDSQCLRPQNSTYYAEEIMQKYVTDKRAEQYLTLTIFMMIIIFIHSAMPADLSSSESKWIVSIIRKFINLDPDRITFLVRKTAHFLEYLLLGIFTAQVFRYTEQIGVIRRLGPVGKLTFRGACHAVICGILYAVSDEIHQYFVPGRSCEIRDMCIDAAGVLCGCLVTCFLCRFMAHHGKMNSRQ